MSGNELRSTFLKFFKEKGHVIVSSSSLVSDDPSVLLTTAGMQQFKPYFVGAKDPQKDFGAQNTTSVQKSFRTSDIDEVGDESHLTFFEMLGNFSFGEYFKEKAIQLAHQFITEELELEISYVSVFEGDDEVLKDKRSAKIWHTIDKNIPIKYFGRGDNWWGPTGEEGPCGPTTEIYVKNAKGDDIEVWNLVFNEFYCEKDGTLRRLEISGVDTGMGLERLAMVVQKTETIFETDLFLPIIFSVIEVLGDKQVKKVRIIADHLRAATFLISDGVRPSNIGAGYMLRRLIRRAMTAHYMHIGASLDVNFYLKPVGTVIGSYSGFYKELGNKHDNIVSIIGDETQKFSKTIEKGIKKLNAIEFIDPVVAFGISSTLGIPYEVIKDVGGAKANNLTREAFDAEFKKHQEVSRVGADQKFKGGLADASEEVVKLHTATHLMNAALRKVLGDHVWQKGSNITTKRTRFDFTHEKKMTDKQLQEVERLVNEWISANYEVKQETMARGKAEELGAIGVFEGKYPDRVSVYTVWDPKGGQVISREFCGGPHVQSTGELGIFTIIKEQSSSAGIRRIRACLE